MNNKINPKIIEILQEYKIDVNDAVTCLLGLYYGFRPQYIPENFRLRILATGIISFDNGEITFHTGLFEEQLTTFAWVETEYCSQFKAIGKPSHVKESTARLKKFFAENPEIRKDDVIGATAMYIRSTEQKYVMYPHYFINKGSGSNSTSTLAEWVNKYITATQVQEGTYNILE
jgi:hypothetical protein